MKKLLFFGDSITDAGRVRNAANATIYGTGYVFLLATKLKDKYPNEYEIINQGNSGNTILDLYERYQNDVINQKPDVLTILVGVNDVWHRIDNPSSRGSKPANFIKLYEEMILDIKSQLPKTKIIIMEPFFTHGVATDFNNRYGYFEEVLKYAKKIKSLARKYQIPYIKLQSKISLGQEKYHNDCLVDGVHPNPVGSLIISKEWIKCFEKMIKEQKL